MSILLPNAENPNPLTAVKELCPHRSTSFIFYNHETGEHARIPCNKYSCPVCGKQKIRRLYAALYQYFSKAKYMRLFTFTIRYSYTENKDDFYKLFSRAFALFFKEIRRSPHLSEKQRSVEYVRCLDYHQTGFVHYHCLFTEYLPQKLLYDIWNHILRRLRNRTGQQGTVNTKGILTCKTAAKYICKYVLKAAQDCQIRIKRYTKSGRLALFKKHVSTGKWSVMLVEQVFCFTEDSFKLYSYLTSNHNDTTPHNFEGSSPP